MSLTAKIKAFLSWEHTSPKDLSTPVDVQALAAALIEYEAGTGSGQIDLLFHDQRTIAASGNEVLDLSGVLADAFGATLTFADVKAIVIKAAAGNTNNVVFGPDATAGWLGPFGDASDRLSLPPGGIAMIATPGAGWAVAAGSTDELYVANSGGSTGVTYDIYIFGASA